MTGRLIIDFNGDEMFRVREEYPGIAPTQSDPTPFAWPLNEGETEDLRWYLEDYLWVPFGVYENRGTQIEAKLQGWGQQIFKSIFGSGQARDAYVRARRHGNVELVLRSDSSSLLKLPWELMADPSRPDPIAVDVISMSRSLRETPDTVEAVPVPAGRLRVLMVISRPSGTDDVGYQMVARPLLSRLEAVRGSVDLVVLRPPTLRALRDELSAAAKNGRPYQIVHFDGHGVFIGGRDDGEGTLVFERPEGGAHYVPATEIARILNSAKIPVTVLNACESGAVGKELETAVATCLLNEGTASVVAMAYNVEAVAASEFMAAFYEKLFSGETVASAVTAGRQQMRHQPARPCIIGQIPLRDWIVPVHYLRREVIFPQAAVTQGESSISFQERLRNHEDLSHEPGDQQFNATDGVFVGRDATFYELEEMARHRKTIVLSGSSGIGKTELAKAFGRWWRMTGGVDQPEWIFWHSFGPGDANCELDEIVKKIGMKLPIKDFATLDARQRRTAVLQELSEHRMLLIWDGFEAVRTMRDRAHAMHPSNGKSQAELRGFLEDLAEHGSSVVLITSRTPEDWLGDVGHIRVRGLEKREAAEYADTLFAHHPHARGRRTRQAFGSLMEFLDGHPLSMKLILPRLDAVDPEVLLGGLRGTVPLAGTGDEEEGWDRSLWTSITYSYNYLSQASQRLLHALSLFQAVADWSMLSLLSDPEINAEFPEIPPRFADATEQDWEDAFREAARLGLVTHVRGSVSICEVNAAFTAFLATAWRAEDPRRYEKQHAAATGALAHIQAGVCGYLHQQLESDDVIIALGTIAMQRYTMCNLLGFALDHKQWNDAALILLVLIDFSAHIGLDTEVDPWIAKVIEYTEDPTGIPPAADTEAGKLWLSFAPIRADRCMTLGLLNEAESLYLKVVAAGESATSALDEQIISSVYRNLGRIAKVKGNLDEAEKWHRKASQAEIQDRNYGKSDSALQCSRLGSAAFNQGNFDEATKMHRRALAIRREAGNKIGIAESCHALGLAAEVQGDFDKAAEWYHEEIDILSTLASPPRMANAYNQLGNIEFRRNRLKEAERWYRETLAIRVKFDDGPGAAGCCVNLGNIAHRNHDFVDAARWFRQALEIAEECARPDLIASCCHARGMLASSEGQLEDAENWYMRALDQETGNPKDHVLTYGSLGLLSEQRNDPFKALEWMIKCVSKFDDFPHPATGPAPEHLVRLVSYWGRDGMDLLDWWWEETTGNPLPDSVRTYVRAGIIRRKRKNRRREQ